MKLFYFCFVALIVRLGCVLTDKACPPGFFESSDGKKCFMIVSSVNDRGRSQRQANKECQNLPVKNGVLASIHSINDTALIVSKIEQYSNDYWIGLQDLKKSYKWLDGSEIDYDNWLNSREKTLCTSSGNACGYLQTNFPDRWRCTKSTYRPKGYICQSDKSSRINKNSAKKMARPLEDEKYESILGYSIKFYSEPKTWADASDTCKSDDSVLLSIHDAILNSAVFLRLRHKALPVWLGLNTTKFGVDEFWSDGWPVLDPYYNSWEGSKLKTTGCVVLDDTMRWKTVSCQQKNSFACQKNPDAEKHEYFFDNERQACPTSDGSWKSLGGYCYKVKVSHQYSRIIDVCSETEQVDQPYVLAVGSIHSDFENFLVTRLLVASITDFTTRNTYIGLTRLSTDAPYKWLDGSRLNYTNWSNNTEPQSLGGQIDFEQDPGKWCGSEPDSNKHVLCKTRARGIKNDATTTIGPATQPSPTQQHQYTGVCLPGWITSPEVPACYTFRVDAAVGWHDALDQCCALGGNLASIHEERTEKWLRAQTFNRSIHYRPDPVWIGMHKEWDLKTKKQHLRWSDGSATDFKNWIRNAYRSLKCYALLTEKNGWDNFSCGRQTGFICHTLKYKALPTKESATPANRPRDNNKAIQLTGITIGTLLAVCSVIVITVIVSVTVSRRYFRSKPDYEEMLSKNTQ